MGMVSSLELSSTSGTILVRSPLHPEESCDRSWPVFTLNFASTA